MIKKFYYNFEYYMYYTVSDNNPVVINTTDWPELVRNEIISTNTGRLVFDTIPTYIPASAFSQWGANISNLTSLTIPDSITSINGVGAFLYCNLLTSINLPDSVIQIGNDPFSQTGITTPVYNSTIFAYLPTSYSGSYSIPSGITTIVGQACTHCDSLTTIVIPDSVTNIGAKSFNRCDNLTYVEIGTGISNIGKDAFLSLGAQGQFICKAINPPTIDTSLGYPATGWALYVPANSVSDYQNDSKWLNAFASIQAIQN